MARQNRYGKKLLHSFLFVELIFAFTSCVYVANYTVSLDKVERPADTKEPFGDTRIYDFKEDGITRYRFEDDYISISWYVDETSFHFSLTNKSGKTLKINWDDVSYVDMEGQAGRVMHSGVKYTERNNSQPSTTIPKGATLSDRLIPTQNVYSEPDIFFGGINWFEKHLFPKGEELSEDAIKAHVAKYAGKTMAILMSILIENTQNDYLFTFQVGVNSIEKR